jgi:glycine cleavage system H protein
MMTNIPANLRYSSTHTWVETLEDESVRVGITDYAQEEMGEVVFIELPESERSYTAGEECAVIESVKTAADIYCPVGGEIFEINHSLNDNPTLINLDPYGEGWLFQLTQENTVDIDELVDSEEYAERIEEE